MKNINDTMVNENNAIMKIRQLAVVALFVCMSMFFHIFGIKAFAANDNTITKGVTIDGMDISGKTKEEALESANEYLNQFTSQIFELDVDGNKVDITAGELGYYWKNTEIIDQAVEFCKEGNVIQRYKEAKSIEKNGISYSFEMAVNDDTMGASINEKCGVYNVPHVNASLKKAGSGFTISQESSGRMIDLETSVSELHDFMVNEWHGESVSKKLTVVDDEPIATVEDCERVKDLLGTYSTKFSTSSSNYSRNKNMENGMKLLDGITLCQGEIMSVNSYLEPWTEDNGWYPGGTYVNGRVEDSLGGGICQVSSTLYNAILNSEIEVVERFNHSMNVSYVPLSMDAALAGTWKDLKIRNNTNTPIYIEAIYSAGRITFNIYGEEVRPDNRRVEYVSETLSTIPSSEVVTQDPTKPADYRVVTSSGHTGYKARLWKRVYVDGVLQSEDVINNSTYSASPTYVTVGTGEAIPPEEAASESDVPAVAEPQTTEGTEQPASQPEQPAAQPQSPASQPVQPETTAVSQEAPQQQPSEPEETAAPEQPQITEDGE